MIVLLLLSTFILGSISTANSSSHGYDEAATLIKESVNFSADPCDDFYLFACGKWIQSHNIPSHRTQINRMIILDEEVKLKMKSSLESKLKEPSSEAKKFAQKVYQQCMESREDEEKEFMIDSWKMIAERAGLKLPLFGPSEQNNADITFLLSQANIHGYFPFFGIVIQADLKNVTRNILYVGQGDLGLGKAAREYYIESKVYQRQMNAYKEYIVEKASLISKDISGNVQDNDFKKFADEIISLEEEMAKIYLPDEEMRNFTAQHNIYKLSDLKTFIPNIDWDVYFNLTAPADVQQYLESDPEILIGNVTVISQLAELLDQTDKRIIANLLMFRITKAYQLTYDKRYRDIDQKFDRIVNGRNEKSPRWNECAKFVMDSMIHATGSLYVTDHFDKNSREEALSMINDLIESFKAILEENRWMDNQTKKEALVKVDNLLPIIGYDDWIIDNEKLDDFYADLNMTDSEHIGRSVAILRRFNVDQLFRLLTVEVNRFDLGGNAGEVNAFYSPLQNAIIFPAAILQPAFFHAQYPKSFNYGAIGYVIGHEITHGFDDTGNQFDENGNLKNWWNPEAFEKFDYRMKDIIQIYSNTTVVEVNMTVNGELTVGENIADLGGLKTAFQAYKTFIAKHGREPPIPGFEQLTNEQTFFISSAMCLCEKITKEALTRQIISDPHTPNHNRANIMIRNVPGFSEAFKCSNSSSTHQNVHYNVW